MTELGLTHRNNRHLIWLCLMPFLLCMNSCKEEGPLGEQVIWIGPNVVDCMGEGPVKCMQIRWTEDGEWETFYDHVQGFQYEVGWTYRLRVNIAERENPPADASSLRYELIEVETRIKDPKQHKYSARPDLYTQQWRLRAFLINGEMTRLGVDQHVNLMVERNTNKVSGLAGCNNYFGQAYVDGFEITFTDMGSTRKMCADEGLMHIEQSYLEMLEKVVTIKQDRNILLTLMTSDSIEMRFIPDPKPN